MSAASLQFVKRLLPKVSRTFAINIRALARVDEAAVSVAYLICRALDTVEDTAALSPAKKSVALKKFHQLFKCTTPQASQLLEYKKWGKAAAVFASSYEALLLEQFDRVMEVFIALPGHYQAAMKQPVLKMSAGMEYFITKYRSKPLAVLKNEAELEKYCYYVAGTVAEFLTAVFLFPCRSKLSPVHYQALEQNLRARSPAFGLALQRINIAKDLFKDKARGWTYLPLSFMQREGLSPQAFLAKEHPVKCQRILRRLLKRTDEYLLEALAYTLALPQTHFRHRLFCLLPLLFAVKNSRLLHKQDFSSPFRHKISKANVFFTVFLAYLTGWSNTLCKIHYHLSRKFF